MNTNINSSTIVLQVSKNILFLRSYLVCVSEECNHVSTEIVHDLNSIKFTLVSHSTIKQECVITSGCTNLPNPEIV